VDAKIRPNHSGDEARDPHATARVDGLRNALASLAVLVVVALFFT
jgi:hypothetical protein